MNNDKTYILNPAYYLRNDVKRCIIGTYEEPGVDIEFSDPWLSLIHPANAQLLSFFNGKSCLSDCLTNISEYFGLTIDETIRVVSRYIGNKKSFSIKTEENTMFLPKNVLIEKNHMNRNELYTPDMFICKEVDFNNQRLYKPISATLELLFDCYTDCTYCYADRSRRSTGYHMSVQQIVNIIKDAKASGIVELDINGGEVLLHKNYKEILREFSINGYFPLISTKIPVKEETLKYLKTIEMLKFQISLDSINPHTLSATLGTGPNYIEEIRKTMKLLDEMGFEWQVHTIITKYNQSISAEIEPLINELIQYKNIKKIRISPAGPSIYKSPAHYNKIKISEKFYKELEIYIDSVAACISNISISMSEADCKYHYTDQVREAEFHKRSICTGNARSFIILPDGKVTICEELYWHPELIIGDLTKQSILEMWNSDKSVNLFNISRKQISEGSPCKACEIFSKCRHIKGVCWKIILMAYGNENWDFPDPRCPLAPEPYNEFYLV